VLTILEHLKHKFDAVDLGDDIAICDGDIATLDAGEFENYY